MNEYIKRIDNLGRIVIPKDIRKNLSIENNENMEISTNNNEIIIKKHILIDENTKSIIDLCNVINEVTNKNIIVTNREKVLYSNIDSLIGKSISNELKDVIINRKEFKNNILITGNYTITSNYIYKNLIIDSNSEGIIIFFSETENDSSYMLIEILEKFINTI